MEEEKKDNISEEDNSGLDFGSCDCSHCHHHCFDDIEENEHQDEE
jgi:hypothetical protein